MNNKQIRNRAIAVENLLRAVIEDFDQEGCSNDLGVISANVVNRCCMILGRNRVTPNDHSGIILEDDEVLTWWACLECGKEISVPADELATIGTPHCPECEGREVEMESMPLSSAPIELSDGGYIETPDPKIRRRDKDGN